MVHVNDVCYDIDELYIQHIDVLEILDHIHNENLLLNEQLHLQQEMLIK
jgi:hypothetical protein